MVVQRAGEVAGPFVYEGPIYIFEQEGGYATYGMSQSESVKEDLVLDICEHLGGHSNAATVHFKRVRITVELIDD